MTRNWEGFYGQQMDKLDNDQSQIPEEPDHSRHQRRSDRNWQQENNRQQERNWQQEHNWQQGHNRQQEHNKIAEHTANKLDRLRRQNQLLELRMEAERNNGYRNGRSYNRWNNTENVYHHESNRGGFYGRRRNNNNLYPDGSHYGNNAHDRSHYGNNRFRWNQEYVQYSTWNESLPQAVTTKITGGRVYSNDNNWINYYEQLNNVWYSANLMNWLNQNENGYIELNFWNRKDRIDIRYDSGYIIFTYNWISQEILLSNVNYNKTFLLNFWDIIPENEIWQTYWNFLQFEVNLDWV